MAILQIFVQESVPDGLQDEDLFAVKDDDYRPGTQEQKSYLFVNTPEATGITFAEAVARATRGEQVRTRRSLVIDIDTKVRTRMAAIAEDIEPEQTSGDSRGYFVDYPEKFSDPEIALIRGVGQQLPEGPTSQGGTVAGGIVYGLFLDSDIQDKTP